MKKLFNGTQEERNARRAQEENAIMNNTQAADPLISTEGDFVDMVSAHSTAEYKQKEDGGYEYKTTWRYNNNDGRMRKWTFSPDHQLIEQAEYICENDMEHLVDKTTYTKNERNKAIKNKVNEVTYHESWEDDDTGETQFDYSVIDYETVTKARSYQMSPFTIRTEEMSYMKPDYPDDEIDILNSELSITDTRYGYTDGQVVEGIRPYGKNDGPSSKNLIGLIRAENIKSCVSGSTRINVNLKTPLISFSTTENYGSSVNPSHRHDVKYYRVMNKLFNKPAYEVRRTSNSELPDQTTISTHNYVYKDTVYGKALIDHEKRVTDISNTLANLPAVKGFKTHDYFPTRADKPDQITVHNMYLFEDLNNIERNAGESKDHFLVTIEGGVYDGSTFCFTTSTGPSDGEDGKYLWCHRIQLKVKDKVKDVETTTYYDYCRDRKDAMASRKVVVIDKYTDFIESIVTIINTTPDEVPDKKTICTVKTTENGNKEISRKTLYRYYNDNTANANS